MTGVPSLVLKRRSRTTCKPAEVAAAVNACNPHGKLVAPGACATYCTRRIQEELVQRRTGAVYGLDAVDASLRQGQKREVEAPIQVHDRCGCRLMLETVGDLVDGI